MLSGDLDRGIQYIQKALVIDPDAHFGREEYQLALAKHLKRAQVDSTELGHSFIYDLFKRFRNMTTVPADQESEAKEEDFKIARDFGHSFHQLSFKPNVFDGVTGMLRFGASDSPDLFSYSGRSSGLTWR